MRWLITAMLVTAGCGRPDIDPAPYDTVCTKQPDTCPAPYRCTTPELLVPSPTDRCYVPCVHDEDCPMGFLCNGDGHGLADGGPPFHFCYPGEV